MTCPDIAFAADGAPRVQAPSLVASPQKIRIAVVVGSLGVGGAQKHIYDLVRLLDPKQFQVTLIVFKKGGFYYDQLLRLGFRILDLDIDSRWDLARRIVRFQKYVGQIKPDILHVFLYYSSLFGCLARILRLGKKPKILLSKRSMNIDLKLDRYLVYRYVLMKVPDAITAVSKSVQKRCFELGAKKSKVHVIENGIEWIDHGGSGNLKTLLGVPQECTLVGTVGSLTVRKGQRYFLNSIPHVLKEFPDVRFVFLGEGNLRHELEIQCKELGISDRVYLPGNLAPAVIYIEDLSVFVLPSLEEGMSNALLEAMMLGLPCVASDIPSNQEVIDCGVNGVLVNVQDEIEIAAAIKAILRDGQFRDFISCNARETVRKHYTIDKMIEKNQNLYTQLASQA